MKRLLLTLLLLIGMTMAAAADTRLVLHYDLTRAAEGETSLNDFSGLGHDGALMDGAAVTTFKHEVVLKNGMKGWVDLGEGLNDALRAMTDFTVSARLYISTVNKYDRPGYVLLSFTQGDNISLSDKGYLYIGAADAGVHLSSSTVADEQSVAAAKGLQTGNWHTFTWTVRGGVVRYYVDGTYQAGGRISLTPEQIGRTLRNRLFSTVNEGEARLASTYLSDFRIYDGALTTAEVCALAGKEYKEDSAYSIGDYTFDPKVVPPGASLHGSARLTEVSGEYILDLAGDNGWYDLGTPVSENLHAADNFTITTDLFIPTSTNLGRAGNFVWSFSRSEDIHTTPTGCLFLGAGQTRYAITPTNYREEQGVQAGAPLAQGVWKNVTYRQQDGLGTLFIDGLPVRSDSIRLTPKGLGKTDYNWLGRSCYAGDAYLSGARYHHLHIFHGALTDEKILDACADLDKLNSELFVAQLEEAKERLTLASDILYDDIALPVNMDDGIAVVWGSSDAAHLSPTGKVTRPALGEDTARVTLTATLTKKSLTARKTFLVRVVPVLDNAESVRTDLRMLIAEFERRNAAADLDCLRTDLSLPTLLSEGSYVRWRSSDPTLVSHAGFLRGFSPKGNKTVSLTALVVKGSEADSVRFDVTVPEAPEYSAYLFAYFTGNSQSQEQIRLALSTDGFNYTPFNNGAPIISSDTIALKKAVRDPHILRGEDGRFYMVVTDMKSSEGWSSNDGLVLLRSDDLIHWTHSAIDFPTTWPERFDRQALTQVWAPQTIWDPEEKKYMVYYSIGERGQHYIIYYSYANDDFTALTEPQVLYDHGANTIDADIVRSDDGTYHMFFKTEGEGNGIQQATASSLHGPWTAERRYLQQTNVAVEGSGVFRLIDSDEWVLMYDCYTSGHYQFCKSSDLHDFTFVCNTQTTGSFTPRHGTVIPVTPDEVARLIDAWPSTGLNATDFGVLPDSRVGNPILPDFHADPEVLYSRKTGRYYVYTTTDGVAGWAGTYFTAYSSADLKEWVFEGNVLDLATAQVIWASGNAWAPAIEEVANDDGSYTFYLYFSGNAGQRKEIGVATAPTPVGPFTDHGESIIKTSPAGGGQQIDVDVFTDPVSGTPYIYWGNGYMACAELNPDRVSLKEGTTRVLTPTGGTLSDYAYREAPYVFYRGGLYYFLWSVDDTGSNNYHVAYGTSTSPTGPINVARNPIVLIQRPDEGIYGTAHNSILQIPGRDEWYIVYHRINKNWQGKNGSGYHRETCIDRLEFNADGTIRPVTPTHTGPDAVDAWQIVTSLRRPFDVWGEDNTPSPSMEGNNSFDLLGRPVEGLPTGIYIINGRKEVRINP